MKLPKGKELYRLNKEVFWAGKVEYQSAREADFWQNKTLDERLIAVFYLNGIAYNFDPLNPPRLNKEIFSMRKQ